MSWALNETEHCRLAVSNLGSQAGADDIEAAFRALPELVASDPRSCWVVDLEQLSRISSLAIAQLIAAVRTVDVAGGHMVLAGVHPFVAGVLRTMRIARILPLYASQHEAMAHVLEAVRA